MITTLDPQRKLSRLRAPITTLLFVGAPFLAALSFATLPAKERFTANAIGRPTLNAPTGPGWSVITAPNGSAIILNAATCVTGNDCWIVGQPTVIDHWNGSSWQIVASPSAADLYGITCLSSQNCWVVGITGGHPVIEHWDGLSWSIVSSPQTSAILTGVSCTSANDCWAVGYTDPSSQLRNTFTEHWNGTAWTIVASPNPSTTSYLLSASCISATDCWAVGGFANNQGLYQTLLEHWDGTVWSTVPSINVGIGSNYLQSIKCNASSDCWAVGYYGHTLIQHWDGNSWTLTASPDAPNSQSNYLFPIACSSASDCWAVGSYTINNGAVKTLAEHWDGNSWSYVPSANRPNTFEHHLYGLACSDTAHCWAVGYYANSGGFAFIEEYASTVPALTGAVSRMTHGTAVAFDIDLPLTGARGVECRSGSVPGNYSVVFSFVNNVTSCGSASTVGGTVVAGPNLNQCTVNLTGLSDAQTINIELDNVIDSQNNTGNVSVPMGVLIGDANGDGFVNVGDTVVVRNHSGETTNSTNFREDLNADGLINVGDTVLVRNHSGDFLP